MKRIAILQINLKKTGKKKEEKLFTAFYLGIKIICESLQW